MSASKSASDDPGHCKTRMYRTRTYQSYGVAEGHSPPASGCRSLPLLGSGCPVGSSLGISRGLSRARGTCDSSAVYDADPLRSLPKPQQRRIHLAVILGRPVPPHQAAVAAGHARHLRWISVVGGIIAVIGAAMLVATAFAPQATWSMWLSPATFLVWGAIFLFFGINARRAARGYHHPGG